MTLKAPTKETTTTIGTTESTPLLVAHATNGSDIETGRAVNQNDSPHSVFPICPQPTPPTTSKTTTPSLSKTSTNLSEPSPPESRKDVIPTWSEMFIKITPYLLPGDLKHGTSAVIALLTTLLVKVINILPPLVIKHAVDLLGAPHPLQHTVIMTLSLYLGLQALSAAVGAVQSVSQQVVSLDAERRFAVRTFRHLHSLSLSYHLEKHIGEITNIMGRGSDSVSTLINTFLFFVLPCIFEVTIVSAVFWKLGTPTIALSTLLAVAAYFFFTLYITSVRVRLRRAVIDASDAAGRKETETLVNFETVAMFGRSRYEVDCYDELRKEYQRARSTMVGLMAVRQFGQGFIKEAGVFVGLVIAGVAAVQGFDGLTAGSFVAIQMYINQLFQPLTMLGWQYNMIVGAFTDLEKVVTMLNRAPEVQDKKGAIEWNGTGVGSSSAVSGEIVFDDVSFKYKTKRNKTVNLGEALHTQPARREGGAARWGRGGVLIGPSLKKQKKQKDSDENDEEEEPNMIGRGGITNTSFRIPAGTTCALVGKSGSGKTTIVRLLLRMYDTDEGKVSVDGHNVRDVTMQSLRNNIGVVAQDTVLFNTTLRENIIYGKMDATDEEIWSAVRTAALEDFVNSLPDKLETLVGDRGMKLSGGERQRVGLARCVIKKPQLILLDEATSALDTATEKEIQKNIAEICQGRTTLMIAHRLSTARRAHQIIVLNEGEIVERGSHEELLQLEGGWYKRMWTEQSNVIF